MVKYAEQPKFSKWVEEQLLTRNWSLQRLVVEMQDRKVSRSDDYINELRRQELVPRPEDIEVLESVFDKLPGTLTHCSNKNEENLWYAFNQNCSCSLICQSAKMKHGNQSCCSQLRTALRVTLTVLDLLLELSSVDCGQPVIDKQ